jgi:hypothetical protein
MLASRIDSFEKLEIVVALHRASHTTSTIDALALQLDQPRQTVREAALELQAGALVIVRSSGELQLLPLTAPDREAIAELVEIYETDRIGIVKALGEIGIDRLRTMAGALTRKRR